MKHPDSPTEPARGTRLFGRRTVLAGVAAGLAGCTSGIVDEPSFSEADVIAAPDGEFRFDPKELTVAVGETVRWGFASGGHNLSCRPEDTDTVVLPDGAEPFASYGTGQDPEVTLISRGETFEHTFDVAGTYTYVCIPHADAGMVGTIHVE